VPAADTNMNNYFWASQTCVEHGGYLPTAAQLIGAAKRVVLESTITDSPLTATIDEDPSTGLKDQREMSATLITTAAGSDAAGSEGVSVGSTGNPRTGEPNPVPEPADPAPATLQYVTVYSNGTKGGFAGATRCREIYSQTKKEAEPARVRGVPAARTHNRSTLRCLAGRCFAEAARPRPGR
jgi:hypothetical protein